ncbi:MAG TPA: DUF4446 family protein [Intrasporangium sp.]|uniref:DUF4446 family protein n=1 Tax=Intrasporangium sp. TaxID=1925024 RepID=UPI002D779938|nr:DUF4446 family protein [Intrasporangium sp.]HET7397233.1 DUF4446 family protein [Intrasporangium sp.]
MSDSTQAVVVVAAAVAAVAALLVALGARRRLAEVRRDFRVLHGDGHTDIARVAAAQTHRIERLGADVARLQSQLAGTQDDVRQSLRNVAVVRYDAFGDMGGRLSFSAAVVDDHGDGLVLSSIHARSESRTYAKGVVAGRSSIPLTPEEQQALASARSGAPTTRHQDQP